MANLIENAQMLAQATRAAAQKLGLELFSAASPGLLGDRHQGARRAWIPA